MRPGRRLLGEGVARRRRSGMQAFVHAAMLVPPLWQHTEERAPARSFLNPAHCTQAAARLLARHPAASSGDTSCGG